jgi:hypothetical protein
MQKKVVQYGVLRALRPKIVVETGVANGVSSAFPDFVLEAAAPRAKILHRVGFLQKQAG